MVESEKNRLSRTNLWKSIYHQCKKEEHEEEPGRVRAVKINKYANENREEFLQRHDRNTHKTTADFDTRGWLLKRVDKKNHKSFPSFQMK